MQLNKVIKALFTIIIVGLILSNIYLLINRSNNVVTYVDNIEFREDNRLSDFETEQNNFKKFSYIPNEDLKELDYEENAAITAESTEEIEALIGKSDSIILDSVFIDQLRDLSDFETTALMLPFKYSDYFDYRIYGQSEPELNLEWNFNVLAATYDYFYLDILYTNEFSILPGPLTKLSLIESSIGYLKSKGIDPSRVVLSVDARYFVWEDRFFENNVVFNQTDATMQADVVSREEYSTKYRNLTALSGLTKTLSNSDNYDSIALSLDLDINELKEIATNLGLRGIIVRYG